MVDSVAGKFNTLVPDFLRHHGVDEREIPKSVTDDLLREQNRKNLEQQVIQLNELPRLSDDLYTISVDFLKKHGVRMPSCAREALLCERNQTYYEKSLYHDNIHAELVEGFDFIPWLVAATRQDFSVISLAETERKKKRRQLFERVFASDDEFSKDRSSFQDFICGKGTREELDENFDRLKRAVCAYQVRELIQKYFDNVIRLLPKEKYDAQAKTKNLRHALMGDLLKLAVLDLDNLINDIIDSLPDEERASAKREKNWQHALLKLAVPGLTGLNSIMGDVIDRLPVEKGDSPDKEANLRRDLLSRLLAGESWLHSDFDETSLKKYRPLEASESVLQTTLSAETASRERLNTAIELFTQDKKSSTADNSQSKVRNNSSKVRSRWWSAKENRPEIIYTPGRSMSARINSISEMSQAQWAECLRLLELIKGVIDSAEKDENDYPTGRFYLRLPPRGTGEHVESLMMACALFKALKEKNSYFLRSVTYAPDQAVTSLLASRRGKIDEWKDSLITLLEEDDLLSLGKTFDKPTIKKQSDLLKEKAAKPVPAKPPEKPSEKSPAKPPEKPPAKKTLQLDMTALPEKQKQPPGFALRVKRRLKKDMRAAWKETKDFSVRFVFKPVGYSIAAGVLLPFVILYFGPKLLGKYIFKPLARLPGRVLDFFAGLIRGKPEKELDWEDLTDAEEKDAGLEIVSARTYDSLDGNASVTVTISRLSPPSSSMGEEESYRRSSSALHNRTQSLPLSFLTPRSPRHLSVSALNDNSEQDTTAKFRVR